MKITLFLITFISEILLGIILIYSLRNPQKRMWPPRKLWHQLSVVTLFFISLILSLIIGYLDANTSIYEHWSRFIFGGLLSFLGILGFLWSVNSLSVYTSLGNKGILATQGAYKYSRNPQTVSLIIFTTGYLLICNSFLLNIVVIIGDILLIISGFAEEVFVREQYGAEHYAYAKNVPMFIGWKSFRLLAYTEENNRRDDN